MITFLTIYMVGLTVLGIITLFKYLFNKFSDGYLIIKFLIIVCNFIVLACMYVGVQSGLTFLEVKYQLIDNKEFVIHQLKLLTYKSSITGTIFYIIGQIIIKFVNHKEYKNIIITSKNKVWNKFYKNNTK